MSVKKVESHSSLIPSFVVEAGLLPSNRCHWIGCKAEVDGMFSALSQIEFAVVRGLLILRVGGGKYSKKNIFIVAECIDEIDLSEIAL